MIPTVVIRHPKERISKCSLEPLRGRPDVHFFKGRPDFRFDATGFVLLHTEGEVITPADAASVADGSTPPAETGVAHPFGLAASALEMLPEAFRELTHRRRPFLLLDSTWRLLPQLEACLTGIPLRRRLPDGVRTAYPRVSKIAEDPTGGLASVEALYLARRLLGDDDPGLLVDYHWRDAFLKSLGGLL